MEQIIQYLNSFYPLPESLKQEIRQLLKHRQLPRKSFLLKAGQVSQLLCFIEKGLLRTFYIKDDKEINTWFLMEGDVAISMHSFFGQAPSTQSIQALEETSIYYITNAELQNLYRHQEFNIIGRRITETYSQQWTQQLQSIKSQTATERYDWLMEHRPQLVLRLPAKYIASYLGITDVTLSKIRSKKRL
ncbi:MAG: Crp/Fnr family transcriptional regulator [Chitinophagaceae bacterium]